MRLAYLDCASTGVSGDKFLGALLDAGYDAAALEATIRSLPLRARIEVAPRESAGMRGLAVTVVAEDEQPARSWGDIRSLIERAPLPEPVAAAALRVFAALAEAEAAAHDVPLDAVHFHEVGAVDSIADVIGAAAGLHALGIERLVCSPVALGSGTVTFSHGTLPVPAPATARLLAGVPVVPGDAASELTTPTGAAIVRALAEGFGPMPPMTLSSAGTGLGSRELPVPNVARLFVGESLAEDESAAGDRVTLLQANVDHMTAEHVAYAAERLREAGALDVWLTPAAMKKGRLGSEISALTREADASALAAALVRETGTLGVRVTAMPRHVEPRGSIQGIVTSLGEVRVKVGGGRVRPEHDDVAEIARRTGLPYDDVARITAEDARAALHATGGRAVESGDATGAEGEPSER